MSRQNEVSNPVKSSCNYANDYYGDQKCTQ